MSFIIYIDMERGQTRKVIRYSKEGEEPKIKGSDRNYLFLHEVEDKIIEMEIDVIIVFDEEAKSVNLEFKDKDHYVTFKKKFLETIWQY